MTNQMADNAAKQNHALSDKSKINKKTTAELPSFNFKNPICFRQRRHRTIAFVG